MTDIQAQVDPQGDTDTFGADFAEFASAREQALAQAGAVEPKADLVQTEASTEPPAAPPAGTEIAADDATAPLSDTAPTDIWSTADPALKAAYQAADEARRTAEHRLSSDAGRVAALTRQLHALRQQGGEQQPATPSGLKAVLESDEIKHFREEYGEVAGPVLKILEAQRAELDRLSGSVQLADQDRNTAFLDSQLQAYAAAHPDWIDRANDTRFVPWLQNQPRYVQEAARRNEQAIVDAAEASDVLSRFKADHGIVHGAAPPQPQQEVPSSPSPDAHRQKQLAATKDVKTRGPAAVASAPEDFGSAFEYYRQKREQQQR